jgi:ATP-dependent DNA helicase RecQ
MKKYTANYTYTNPNFVIQNLVENQIETDLLPVLCVLKNILQRGFPTTLSKYLQKDLGSIHKLENFNERFLFTSIESPEWYNTIKGDEKNNYYPAKTFFENIIPKELGEYYFLQSLIIPEIEINEITGESNDNFINQQVDFYLPQAKLVIEIDGQQHKTDNVTRVSDSIRDNYLKGKGVTTIRITTSELKNENYQTKIILIREYLQKYEKLLSHYRTAYDKIKTNSITDSDKRTKLLPTGIIRFQILLLELMKYGYLQLDKEWRFNIFSCEDIDNYAELAINDVIQWLVYLIKWKKRSKYPVRAGVN